jgi:RHS repeat-associated protein
VFISSRRLSYARLSIIRLIVLTIVASVGLPISPAQAEAIGDRTRHLVEGTVGTLRGLSQEPRAVDQDQAFAAERIDDPSQNATHVTHFRFSPRHLKLYLGEAFTLVAVPLGRSSEVVQGVAIHWESRDESVAMVSSWGEVTAMAPGQASLTVSAGTAHANVSVEVLDGVRPRISDAEWDAEHGKDGDDWEAINEPGAHRNANLADAETATSPVLPASGRQQNAEEIRQLARPAAYHPAPHATPGTSWPARTAPAARAGYMQGVGYVIDGGSTDTFALDAVKYNNDLGTTRFTAQEAAQGAHHTKHNLGSYDYFFSASVLGLGGRGIGVNLAMNYNSRLWNKDGSKMTFNYNRGWPAAGWSLGYGRIIENYNNTAGGDQSGVGISNRPGDYLLLHPDGSRVHLAQTWDATSGRYLHNSTDGSFLVYIDLNGKLRYPDGTVVQYSKPYGRLVPASIQSRNGDLITVLYQPKTSTFPYRWAVSSITDTLGRVITFNYDLTNNVLTSITAPDQGGTTRTIVQIDYQNITFSYSFSTGLTVDSATANNTPLGVVRRIYYPATGRGYVFSNYSSYGMAKKISSQIGMTAAGDGTEVAYTQYTYGDTGVLNDAPQFTARGEWWQGKTDANGTADGTPSVYTYSRAITSAGEEDTVSSPAGVDFETVTTIDSSDPSSFTYGKVLKVVHKKKGATGAILRQMDYTYTIPTDGGIQLDNVVTTIEPGTTQTQKTKVGYDYGNYGRVANVYEYGLKVGGIFNVRRRTKYMYIDDVNYINVNMLQMVKMVLIYDALQDNDNTNDVLKAKTQYFYDDYTVKGGMEYYGLPTTSYPPNHSDKYTESKTERGNVTGVTTYSAFAPDVTTVRYTKYDIFGNVVNADVSCCQVKNATFNSSNYYSQPMTTTDGTAGVAPFLTTSYAYDFNTGLLKQTTDPNNLTTGFIYDAAWRLNQVTAPSGAVTMTSFDKDVNQNDLLSYAEQTTYMENSSSKTVTGRSWVDGAGHVLRAGSGAGSAPTSLDTVKTVYDSLGRVAKQSNPYAGDSSGNGTASYWTVNVYDEQSRVIQVTLPGSQTVQTSYSGITTTVTDQVGRKRQSQVDGLGRLVSVVEQNPATGVLDATNYQTSYSYDVLDNLTQVNQGGQLRTFVYDALSRVISQTTPEAGTLSLTYFDSNNVKKQADARGVETHYSYDALNRLNKVWYTGAGGDDTGTVRPALPATVAATADLQISYNNYTTPQAGNGQTAVITDAAGTESYSYDLLGRLSTRTRLLDSRSYSSQYLYNTANQMTTLIYPSGKRLRMNHDGRGRMSGLDKVDTAGSVLASYMSGVNYRVEGMMSGLTLGNGVAESYDYSPDRLQMISQTAMKGASTLLNLTYSYAAAAGASGVSTTAGNSGQLMSITGTVNSQTGNQGFSYDNLGRLATASGWSVWGRRYGYDRFGNRTGMWDAVSGGNQLQNVAIAQTGAVANNRIANVNGVTYTYDASGNVTGDGGHSYSYDGAGRQASVDSGSAASSIYDFADRRVKKTAGGVMTHYLYEGSQVIAEYNAASGALLSEYVYAGGRLLAREQAGVQRYYLQDRLSTRLVTDAAGLVVGTENHLPFGEEAGVTGEQEKHRFTTYERDSESGTDYAMNRQHQSANGRFMQPDPVQGNLALPQSLNRYAYAGNDPINAVDPSGLDPVVLIDGVDYSGGWHYGANGVYGGYQGDLGILVVTIRYQYGYFDDLQEGTVSYGIPLDFAVTPVSYPSGGGGNRRQRKQLDPNGEECKKLAEKIANIRRDIDEAKYNIDNNPSGLPETVPFGSPRHSIQGHRDLLKGFEENMARRLEEYRNKCGGGDPPPIPVRPPYFNPDGSGNKSRPQNRIITPENVGKAIGAGVGAYLLYRGIRMLPSLLPPLWWTIPANAAIP